MEMKLDPDTMEAMVTKAIFDMMTPEKRDELLRGSIQSLLKREHKAGFDRFSELERLFADAARNVAFKIISQKLESDPAFEEAVRSVFEDAWKAAVTGEERKRLAERLAGSIRATLTGDRY